MKKILLMFLTFASYNSLAQWQGTNPVYFNAGNVGIGTSTPGYALEIKSNANLFSLARADGSRPFRISNGAIENVITFNGAVMTFSTDNPYISFNNSTGRRGLVNGQGWLLNSSPSDDITTNTRLDVRGLGTGTNLILRLANASNVDRFIIRDDGRLIHQGDVANDNNATFVNTSTTGYGIYSKGGVGSRYTFHFENQTGASILYGRSGDGFIGLGTTSPTEKLDIGGYDKVNIRVGHWATLGILGSHLATVVGNNVKASTTSNNMEILTTNSADGAKAIKMQYNEGITFHTLIGAVTAGNAFSSERMRIDNTGNVGIGTTTPSHALSITAPSQNLLLAKSLITHAVVNIESAPGFNSYLQFAPNGVLKWDVTGETTGNLRIYDYTAGLTRLTIAPTGNVGIGTTNPNQKLTVNGTIYGKEVKVDLSVPGPDYVFENDYKLLSLEEIKTYIDKNKHLPEVPSAKEMEANGVNLGEMNMLLLKKIEELTLHIIDLEKRIKTVESKN